jgi:hypothetical protein
MPIVEMAISYETPLGFHRYASDFAWWAERARDRKTEFYTPTPYYLYCRALELTLKSYLLAKGVPKKRIKTRKLGHNLVALLDLATKLGIESYLSIKPTWRSHLTGANSFYESKEFEYFNVGNVFRIHDLPSLYVLHEFSSELLKATLSPCMDAAGGPPPPEPKEEET